MKPEAESMIEMGKDLIDIASAKKVNAVFVAGDNDQLFMKAAAGRTFIVQAILALAVGVAKTTYVQEFGYDLKDATLMVIKEIEDKIKLEVQD